MDQHTRNGALFTDLVLEVFRLNGQFLSAGDGLVADIGLTSARWQVLGALYYAGAPQTVSILARSMGLTRQTVQRTANDLAASGLIAFRANPAHRRAQLILFTPQGRSVYAAASARQTPWANAVAAGFDPEEIAQTLGCLVAIRKKLDLVQGDAHGPEPKGG